jgi:hypothetical protein
MALVSMKTEGGMSPEIHQSEYGYGTEIRLNEDQCKALGISKPLEAGTKVSVEAVAFVKSATQSVGDDAGEKDPEVYMCLQITDLGMKPMAGRDKKVMAKSLYADSEE